MSNTRDITDAAGQRRQLHRIEDAATRPSGDEIARLLDELTARGRADRLARGGDETDAGSGDQSEAADALAEVYSRLAARGRATRSVGEEIRVVW